MHRTPADYAALDHGPLTTIANNPAPALTQRPPEPGDVWIVRGQRYVCLNFQPHTRRNGTETALIVWASRCAECGEVFEFASPRVTKYLSRRCAAHRACGRRVRRAAA